jgi:hypothetical protein
MYSLYYSQIKDAAARSAQDILIRSEIGVKPVERSELECQNY